MCFFYTFKFLSITCLRFCILHLRHLQLLRNFVLFANFFSFAYKPWNIKFMKIISNVTHFVLHTYESMDGWSHVWRMSIVARRPPSQHKFAKKQQIHSLLICNRQICMVSSDCAPQFFQHPYFVIIFTLLDCWWRRITLTRKFRWGTFSRKTYAWNMAELFLRKCLHIWSVHRWT